MDSVTHLTLGACIGELILGKRLGKKAMLWGALAQSLPDADVFAGPFVSPEQGFIIHRGITHSLLFAVVAGAAMTIMAYKLHHKNRLSLGLLMVFFCMQLGIHDLLDTCNSYGTGLLEPFSHYRFSVNLLYVADPLFTIGLLIASLFLIFKSAANLSRAKWAWAAIAVSGGYLCFALFCKLQTDARARESLASQKLHPAKYFSTPAPLTSMLWYIVAVVDTNYYTSYSSVWDNSRQALFYQEHPKNQSLLKRTANTARVNDLVTFAENDYTVSQIAGTNYINIVRFGQVQGWAVNNAPFAFSYPLADTKDAGLLLQKGRLKGWNKHTIKRYLQRIAGNTYRN